MPSVLAAPVRRDSIPLDAGDLRLGPAAPVRAEAVADWLRETDVPFFDGLHGGDYALGRRHLAAQWRAPRGLHSHAHALDLRDDAGPAGVAVGWDAAVQEAEMAAHVRTGFRAVPLRSAARMLVWWACRGARAVPPPARDAFYLAHLAVDPARRGRGLGRRLLAACVRRARRAGYARLQLDVCEDNPAVGLYRRAGLTVAAVNRVPELEPLGFPPHLRMELRL